MPTARCLSSLLAPAVMTERERIGLGYLEPATTFQFLVSDHLHVAVPSRR